MMQELISRQAAIDEVRNYYDPEDTDPTSIEDRIKRLPPTQSCEYWDAESGYCALHRPSAQPEDIARDIATIIENEKDMRVILKNAQPDAPDTNGGDIIYRRAAIDAADRADYTGLAIEDVKKVTDEVVKEIKKLPSAQPEIIRCKDCKHKHIENMVWTCPFGLPGGENFFCGYGAEPYKEEQE